MYVQCVDAQGNALFAPNGLLVSSNPQSTSLVDWDLVTDAQGKVEWVNDDQLRFILKEGKKRQIRRMCELVGLRVTGLKRVRIGHVRLGDLPLGQWRFLRDGERF